MRWVVPGIKALLALLIAGSFEVVHSSDGQSWKRHVVDASSMGADGVRSADVNGDGLPDLVTGWEQGNVTRIYLMVRSAIGIPQWQRITVGTAPDVEDALFFDADTDGKVDVISSTEGRTQKVLVHWAPKNSADYIEPDSWKTETLYENGSQWMFAVPMDVDGKNGLDLIIGGKNESASVGWIESPAQRRDVRQWAFHSMSQAGWIMSLMVEDMNHDGYLDVLLSDRRGDLSGVRWLEHPGVDSPDLRRPWNNHWIGVRGHDVMFIDAADLDGDGVKEVIAPHYSNDDRKLSILKRDSEDDNMWREYSIRYPPIAGRPKAAAVGDIDLDRRPDIVLSTGEAHGERRGIMWMRFRDTPLDPEWETFDVSGTEGVKFDLNLLLDIDGDGDLDIVNSEENDNAAGSNPGLGVVWYENPTARGRPQIPKPK